MITSNIHMVLMISQLPEKQVIFVKNSVDEFAKAIDKIRLENREEFSLHSIQISRLFKKENVHCAIQNIYEQINT